MLIKHKILFYVSGRHSFPLGFLTMPRLRLFNEPAKERVGNLCHLNNETKLTSRKFHHSRRKKSSKLHVLKFMTCPYDVYDDGDGWLLISANNK